MLVHNLVDKLVTGLQSVRLYFFEVETTMKSIISVI